MDPTDLYKSLYPIKDEEIRLKKLNKLYWCQLKCGSSWLCLDQCSQSRFIPTTTFQPITTPSTEESTTKKDSNQLSDKIKQFWKCRFCGMDNKCWKMCLKQKIPKIQPRRQMNCSDCDIDDYNCLNSCAWPIPDPKPETEETSSEENSKKDVPKIQLRRQMSCAFCRIDDENCFLSCGYP